MKKRSQMTRCPALSWLAFLSLMYVLTGCMIGQENATPLASPSHRATEAPGPLSTTSTIGKRTPHVAESRPRADQHPRAVTATTDQSDYRRGASIAVTIHNDLETVIYAFLGRRHCSMVQVQQQEAGHWEPLGACMTAGPTFFMPIAPESELQGVLGAPVQGSPEASTPGPMLNESTAPKTSRHDLRTLPRAKPWKPGDPVREMPDRRRPAPEQHAVFGSTDGDLRAGTYRIAFHFKVGDTSGSTHVVYSKAFVVHN